MKKKTNRKPSYKKGGEAWVSEKMANLPMYALGAEFYAENPPENPPENGFTKWLGSFGSTSSTGSTKQPAAANIATNAFGFPTNVNPNFGKTVTASVDTKPTGIKKRVDTKKTGAVNTAPITTSTASPANIFAKPELSMNAEAPLTVSGTAYAGMTPEEQMKRSLAITGDTSVEVSDTEAQKTLDGFNKVESDAYASENRQQQFFNPYGGYDLATSAGMLGQSIKEKNTLGIVGSSAKLLSGLGRNVMGGMGLANREQFIKGEYDDNVRDAQRPRTMVLGEDGGYFRKGGEMIKRADGSYSRRGMWDNIRDNKGSGKSPTKEMLEQGRKINARHQEGGMQAPEQQIMQQVVQALQQGTDPEQIMQQLMQEGLEHEQVQQIIQTAMQQLQGQQEPQQPQMQRGGYQEYSQYADSYFQEGGEQQAQQPSAEQIIQAYAESIQQDPAQIMQQLQQMQPEEQQQAIQQMMAELQGGQQEQQVMQRGGQIAKKLTGEYTLEEGENPNVNSEIEHNEYVQTPDGKVTKAEGETHEKGGIEVELEPGTRIVSDHLKLGVKNAKHYSENFDLEVKANDTYAKVLKRFTTKSGLQKIVDEQERIIAQLEKSEEAAQGSTMSESTAALNKQFLSEKLNTLEQEKAPLEEARKALLDDVFNKQEESKPASERSDAGAEFRMGGSLPEYQNAGPVYPRTASYGLSEKDSNVRFNDWYRSLEGNGYTGPRELNEARAWQTKNRPNDILKYYDQSGGNQDLNANHMDIAKKDFPAIFKAAGLDPNKASAKYTPEEKGRFKVAFRKANEGSSTNEDPANMGVYNKFILDGNNDRRQDWRAPLSPFQMDIRPATVKGQEFGAFKMPNIVQPQIAPQGTPAEVYNSPEEKEKKARGEGAKFLNLPDQSPMMPDSLTGALKATRRYDRVDPMQLSANGQVAELQGQANTAMQNINLQPGSEAAAAAANIATITQQNIGKTYSEVNRANMAQDMQAQQFNAQTQRGEEDARVVDLKDYESKIYQAQATTDANVRGYYNQLKAVDLANYNAVNNVNSMNQMYDHFGYTNNGVEQTGDQTYYNADNYIKPTAEEAKTRNKRTAKARFGGKKK